MIALLLPVALLGAFALMGGSSVVRFQKGERGRVVFSFSGLDPVSDAELLGRLDSLRDNFPWIESFDLEQAGSSGTFTITFIAPEAITGAPGAKFKYPNASGGHVAARIVSLVQL